MLHTISIVLSALLAFQPAVLMASGADTSAGKADELYVKVYLRNYHQTYQRLLNQMNGASSSEAITAIKQHMIKSGVKLNSQVAQPTIENGQVVVYKTKDRKITLVPESNGFAVYDGKEYWRYEKTKSLDANYFSLVNYIEKKSMAKAADRNVFSDLFINTAHADEKDVKALEFAKKTEKNALGGGVGGAALFILGSIVGILGAPVVGFYLLVAGITVILAGVVAMAMGTKKSKELQDPLFQCNDKNEVTFVLNGKRVVLNSETAKGVLEKEAPELLEKYDVVSKMITASNLEVCEDTSKRGQKIEELNKVFLRLYGRNAATVTPTHTGGSTSSTK